MADYTNFQALPIGFGSYLDGIIPEDQAIAAGAFATAMKQIRNIDQVTNVQEFAKIVYSNETIAGLPQTAGTDLPTNQPLVYAGQDLVALGGGIYGTFTMSNFFGCMSGLPHPLRDIFNGIVQLQTTKLFNIYHELYLAVAWECAEMGTVDVNATAVETSPGVYDYFYEITGASLVSSGGGYGRGTAPPPNVIFSDGSATAEGTIGTDDTDLGTFGKVLGVSIISSTVVPNGSGTNPVPPVPVITATIECPPTDTLPVSVNGDRSTSGTNTAPGTVGWTNPLDTVVQEYIDQANEEISTIFSNNVNAGTILNTNYDATGIALKQEQRARYIAIPPVPIPRDKWLNLYPTALYVFTDALPNLGQNTMPHMTVQTLENISNMATPGGQSVIAMMRQDRNANRMKEVGINQDNNLPDKLPLDLTKLLVSNGVLPEAREGIPSSTGAIFTIPSWSTVISDLNVPIAPIPATYYDPTLPGSRLVNQIASGNISLLVNGANTDVIIASTNVPIGGGTPINSDGTINSNQPSDIYPNINMNPEVANIVPVLLDTAFSSSTLLPSTYNIPDAIDKVIECNCDCWIN